MSQRGNREPHDLGLHRVVEPEGALPQAATRLDAGSPMYANEVAIDVETLNIDSASFSQIRGEVGDDEAAVGAHIEAIVQERGKMQNPVTGSGGMLLGEVVEVGPDYHGPALEVGSRVATLVSLTLTPLRLDKIEEVRLEADQVDVQGRAYLWPSSPLVVLPEDMEERVALSALDVCGAPAQTRRLVEGIEQMVILGAGKSGMLCAAAARAQRGEDVEIIALDWDEEAAQRLKAMGLADRAAKVDARRPVEVLETVQRLSGCEEGVELCINTCNISDAEMGAVLSTRRGGVVYFFNMATDFSRAALGCEGVGKDVTLVIGNGYVEGHAEWTLSLLRHYPEVSRQLAAIQDGGPGE